MNCFAINSVQPILRNGMQQKLLQYRCHEIRLFEANMQDEYTSKCYTFFGSKFVLFSIPYHVLFHLTSCSSFMTVLKQESSWSSKKCTQYLAALTVYIWTAIPLCKILWLKKILYLNEWDFSTNQY